jgi:TatD DNase family protein
LGVGLVDSHVHLDLAQFDEERDSVVSRAGEAGVVCLINPGRNFESSRRAIELAERYPQVYAAVGVHPHEAAKEGAGAEGRFRGLAAHPRVVAIGEIGLDFFRKLSPPETQERVFRRYLRLAKELNLPAILHCRDAFPEVCVIVGEESSEALRGVLHSFSGDESFAGRLLEAGFHISFSGQITYPKSDRLRSVAEMVPIERILIETDSPFLTPQPERGKRNEPAFVRYVAEELARIKGLSFEDVERITTRNVRGLFGVGPELPQGEIAYKIRNSLYLNITNECTNRCVFCRRLKNPVVKGHDLRLERDPSFEEIVAAIGDASGYEEVVFCGYGEPLLRLELVKDVARYLRGKGFGNLRVDTNGQANLVHGRNVVPELIEVVRRYSVSLNAATAEEYDRLCRPKYGPAAYEAVKEFIRECKKYGASVMATVVALPGIDPDACRRVAEEELGVPLRVRAYNKVG